ncbi:hypothetical protein ACJX0J_011182, partial [Zea mays]
VCANCFIHYSCFFFSCLWKKKSVLWFLVNPVTFEQFLHYLQHVFDSSLFEPFRYKKH